MAVKDKPAGEKLWTRAAWFALSVTAIIIFLHFFLWLHAGGFCGDEVGCINLSGSDSLSRMAHDSFPVLMPVMIKCWTAIGFGGSDLKLRLLGTFVGLGIVAALWLPSWKIRRAPPLISLVLFGLNATAIYREDYLRAYGVGTMLIVLTLFAMCRLLEQPTWPRAGILTLAATLSVQALYQNAVFFAAIAFGGWAICLLRRDKMTAVKIFGAAIVAAISLLPYYKFIFQWTQSTISVRPGFSSVAALDNLNTLAGFPLPQYVWIWALLALAIFGIGFVNFFQQSRQPARAGEQMTAIELQVFAGVTLLAAMSGYFIFLKFAALITSPWYFLPMLALGAVCFDLAISWTLFPRTLRAAVWGILLATAGISTAFAIRDLNCRYTNVDLIVNRLQKEISPHDYVVVTPWYFGISFNRYYHGDAAWDTLPQLPDHSTYRFDLIQAQAADASQPVFERIANTLQSGHRVWIVGLMEAPTPGNRAHSQAAQFISDRSDSFREIELKEPGRIDDYEKESLLVAEGWKEKTGR